MTHNRASFIVKQKAFNNLMETWIKIISMEVEQNPMYPDDPSKVLPTGDDVEIDLHVRFIISASSTEGYTESNAGFMPESFRFLLSKKQIQEDSYFTHYGLNWKTGKVQTMTAFGKVYGYRIPIQIV